MRKRRVFLSLILMFAIVCFSACKKKDNDTTPELSSPTINVSISNRKYYVGESLQDISLVKESSDTPGTLEWVSKSYTLVLGKNECYWKFTPKDTATYTSTTGKIEITAVERPVNPEIEVSIVNGVYYAGQKVSVVPLEYTPNTIQGTLTWANPNAILAIGQNEYSWKFTPTNLDKYSVATGRLTVVAIEPVVTGVSIKTYPNKMQYEAFDQFDPEGMIVEAIDSVGKRFEAAGWNWKYKTGESLVAGNNLIEISYGGFKCDLAVNNVSKIAVHEPTFVAKDYTGSELTAELTTPATEFTFDAVSKINAGSYTIDVTLRDTQNYEWYLDENKPNATVQAEFIINKAALEVATENVNVEYDGFEHFATVSAIIGYDAIYYSLEDLVSKENWIENGENQAIAFVNAIDNQKVYYYIVGDNNHLDTNGWLTVTIRKSEIELTSEYCYTIYTGENIEYPEEYLKIYDTAGNEMTGGTKKIDYYISYPNQKTSLANSGAKYSGGAPKNVRNTPYEIVYVYEDQNVIAIVTAYLFIDTADNIFYAKDGEDKFAYKENPTEYGSIELCEYYLEFELGVNDITGLYEITYVSKIGAGEENNGQGNLIYRNGYKLVNEDGSLTPITIYKNTDDKDPNPTSITIDSVGKTLTKWVIPDYIGTYAAQTIADDKIGYDEKFSYLTIENNYGTIRFIYEYHFEEKRMNSGDVYGGSGVVEGVTRYETNYYQSKGQFHELFCYRTDEEFVESAADLDDTNNTFYIRWNTTNLDGSTVVDPQSVTIVDNDITLKNIIGVDEDMDMNYEVAYTKIS